MCKVRTNIETDCIKILRITVEIRPKENMISPVITVIEGEDTEETVHGGAGVPQHAVCGLCTDWLREYAGTHAWASASACAGCAWVHPPAPTSQSVS